MAENAVKFGTASTRQFLRIRPVWAVASVLLLVLSVSLAWLQAPFPRPQQPIGERSVLEMLWYPIEVNGPMRLPSAPAAMSGFAIAADRAWAVGGGGTILTTADGGQSWAVQTSGTPADLASVQFQADGQHGWVVGGVGTILATADGGRSWAAQTSGTRADLYSVQFQADGQHGWAVGHGGTILATADGGRSWAAQTSGTRANLWSVQFQGDGQHGWAVGSVGTILATADGGRSWAAQTSGTRASLRSVQFQADGQRGWVVGAGGTILATADGGRSWAAQTSGTSADLWSVQFQADGQHGWAVGFVGTILATADGGRSWDGQTSGTQADLLSVQFQADGQRGWVVGAGGTILATADGGRSWDAQTSGTPADLTSVQFQADGQRGWAVGAGGTILATADGGRSWDAQTSGTSAKLWSVRFQADGQRGWAVGAGGTILATADGGRSWAAQTSGTSGELWSVRFQADGQRGWAVGNGGTIRTTADGGQSWAAQTSGTPADLTSVQFQADGQRGWAVGNSGTILATADGGRSWDAQTSGTSADLWSVQFQADGQRGWAAGTAGMVLRTVDGGKTWAETDSRVGTTRLDLWTDQAGSTIWAVGYPPALLHSADGGDTWKPEAWPLRYARYPAPWFWMTMLLAGWLWARSIEFGRYKPEDGAEATGFTDAPTADFEQDRLRFGPLAKGISRFLRNVATEPPLTLAISGDWGSGKSSLMALICADLKRYGSRPVWFNAWHNQKDEQLLAGLLSAIRDQALPSSLTLDGWAFRLRLLWLRSKKHFALTFVMILLGSATVAFLTAHDLTAWDRMFQIIQRQLPWIKAAANGDQATISKADLVKLVAQLASAIATLVAIGRALTAFGTDPAVLLSATAEKFRLKDASALTNFRASFAEQFHEVTEALPQRMVIVIDDVDRCRSEAILDVMEAVNFLVSSGSCFVIFGMATERVQAALALAFDKIAVETADLNTAGDQPAEESKKETIDREARRRYARDYLEKLVNLEIVVPSVTDLDAGRLFDRHEANERELWVQAWRPAARLWPIGLVLVAVALGGNFGWRFVVPNPPPAVVVQSAQPTISNSAALARLAPSITPTAGQEVQLYVPAVQRGDPHNINWSVFALPLALLAACLAGLTLYRLRATVHQVRDTRGFQDALRAWAPLVHSHRTTPRAIKRFGNRIRYLVMLHQAERLDESGFDTLRRMCNSALAWIGRRMPRMQTWTPTTDPVRAPVGANLDMAEENIVALGALNECFGLQWRNCATGAYSCNAQREVIESVLRGLDLADRPVQWPPSHEELDSFEASLRGIRTPSS
jgi:photosystem II stability/assembly factor-like uncharacterized protein